MTVASPALQPAPRARLHGVTTAGIVVIGVWVLIAAVLVVVLLRTIDGEVVATYGGRLASGFLTTIKLVLLSLIAGAFLSIPVAAGRLSSNRILGALAYAYSYFFRGTPLIAQLFLLYYGAGQFSPELRAIGLWTFFRDAFNCAFLAFTLNTAAYQAEILAGAIRNVGTGQREAAGALGLHTYATMWKIVLPQALISALRPYGNETVLLIKASAIASIVTVLDLMGQTRFAFSKTYDLSFYFLAAIIYLVTVEILSRAVNAIERRLTRHLRRDERVATTGLAAI